MNTKNTVLMQMARESLKGKWTIAIPAFLIIFIISMVLGFIPLVGQIVSMLIAGPLVLGAAILSLNISRGQEVEVGQIFNGFNDFGRALLAYILMAIFILLWALLLLIPGIIAAISYSMTFYILADNPSVTANEAINMSKKMMYGYKMKMLGLSLMFFLLGILCIFTLGIGFLWLYPYMQVTMAKFYEDIKGGSQPESPKVEPVPSPEPAKENTEPAVAEPVSQVAEESKVESQPEAPAEPQENIQKEEAVATEPAK